jgi:GNAT superfamily N-acetyltransferase
MATTSYAGWATRWGMRRDVPAMGACGTWSENRIETVLRRRDCISMVAECGDVVGGYMCYQLNRHSLGLLTLAVRPDLRRSGIGRALVAKLKYKLLSHGRARIVAAGPDGNLGALLFLRAGGFLATGYDRAAGEVLMTWTPTAEERAAFAVRW